jgi:hypothetical protein
MVLQALPELQDHKVFRVQKEPLVLLAFKGRKVLLVRQAYKALLDPLAQLAHRA